jgi:hypothetical protein
MLSADPAIREEQRVIEAAQSTFSGSVLKGFHLKSVELVNVGVDEASRTLKPVKRKAGATLTLEIEVTEEMCNLHSNLHGGCAAFLLDCERLCLPSLTWRIKARKQLAHVLLAVGSSLPLIAISNEETWSTSGVSQNFNLFFMQAVPAGTKLQ